MIITPVSIPKGILFRLMLTCFIIVFASRLISQSLISTTQERNFYDLPEGLSQSNVNAIFQDYRGFVWIGTDDGLNKYDGYRFTIYKNDPLDSSSISHSNVSAIIEDGEVGLWVGLERGGLNHYDFKTDRFSTFDTRLAGGELLSSSAIYDLMIDRQNTLWIATNHGLALFELSSGKFLSNEKLEGKLMAPNIRILDLFLDQKGAIWIGTDGDGLWRYDQQNNKLNRFGGEGDNVLKSSSIRAIYEQENGTIWAGTANGLAQYIPETDEFSLYDELSNGDVWCLSENAEGELIVGTDGGGLNIISVGGGLQSFLPDERNRFSINDNVIRELYRDRQGNLWIGMFRGGINLLHSHPNKFKVFNKGQNSLNNSSVLSLAKNGSEGIWIGTDGGGLNHFDLETGSFSYNEISSSNWNPESDYVVLSALEDHEGGLWTGTYEGGLKYYPQNSEKVIRFQTDGSELINNSVLAIHQDINKNIWIGTNGGINLYDWKSKTLKRVATKTSKSLIDNANSIRAIYEDIEGDLWFGIMGGIRKVDPGNNKIEEYIFDGHHKNYLTISIHENKQGNFWLGTDGGGLLLFDPEQGIIDEYYITDGLPSDMIFGILEDQSENLWLSTGAGISRFTPQTRTFRTYNVSDGLQDLQFNRNSFLADDQGYFWFGGINGLNVFHPDSIYDNLYVPPVAFTNLRVLNQSVNHADGSGFLSSHINSAKRIELDHSHSVFTIEFASLNYVFSERNQYSFLLEGFDSDWRFTTDRREAIYTNLDPGSYTFWVKSSNNDGIWNENAASIEIVVHPPWWRTWLAYSIYLIVSVVLLTWARQVTVHRERLKAKMKLEHLELTHLQEIDGLKSKFFANISHELRTPLSLILDPLKLMYDREAHPKVQRQLRTMIRNAQRLLRLINQLLDLSKLETSNMQLEAQQSDVVQWFRQLLPAFSLYADRHNIKFDISLPSTPVNAEFDHDKLEKIVSNLLSNALKFTRDNGSIKISVKCVDKIDLPFTPDSDFRGWIKLKVEDNGVGIPKDRIQFIFDRFYQVDGAHHRQQEGTGIGLSLTKELVELHKGQIFVESEERKGTRVKVFIPIIAGQPSGIQKTTLEKRTDKQRLYSQIESTVELGETKSTDIRAGKNAPQLLIVEDNPDVLEYICDKLGNDFLIKEANNGKVGLEMALKFIPDLIISDIMMPVMDGIEFTTHIKENPVTSHIPVILLTAKAEEKDIFKGIDSGADGYMVKPLDSKLLEARVKNLIASRDKLRATFAGSKVIDLEPKEVTATPVDELFLKKALQGVEKNIANSDYTVEDFGNDVGLSRMQLYRKLKALTNQSPNEFIRTVRLKRAAQLIHLDQMTISQITYEVGFNDLQYFRDCFKKHFGVNPSDYGKSSTDVSFKEA